MADSAGGGLTLRLAGALGGLGVLLGRRCRTPGAVVFAYHDIGDDTPVDYLVSPGRFRRHLVMAQRAGLRFVPLAELTEAFLAGRSVDDLASVVFDDALAGVHHQALPILAELDVPATVFVVTDALGESPPWWSGAGRTMTPAELCDAAAMGVDMAAHTRHHPSLVAVAGSELTDEVAGSRARLEDLVQRPVDLFAYPFGHHDPAVRAAVAGAGFRAAYTFLNGRIVPGLDPFKLPRLTMSSTHDAPHLAYHVARSASSWPDHQADRVGGS
jgi:peptidoglycan/xylan/chitin deacetylase (PgdA/CDA1 family)